MFARLILFVFATQSTTTAVMTPATCQLAAPNQTTLHVPSVNVSVPESPFGLVYARNDIAFVSLGSHLGVLNTSTTTPTLVHSVALPSYNVSIDSTLSEIEAAELTITADKREVWIAYGPGVVVVDVERAISRGSNAIIGSLVTTEFSSALIATFSADEDYAFISQEYGNNATQKRGSIQVFKINRPENGIVSGDYLGKIVLEYSVVGSALSRDGQNLFVVSGATRASLLVNQTRGAVSVLDVPTLKTDPSQALRGSVDAGCQPVRIVTSPDGRYVWITARQSNQLVVFDTTKLVANKTYDTLVAKIQVGTSPVGLTFINGGRQIVTADSNRFNYTGATTGVTVVDVEEALGGIQSFPRVPTGMFPRAFAVSPDGNTLLVSQYDSKAVQAVDISQAGSYSTSPLATNTGQQTSIPTAAAGVNRFNLVIAVAAGVAAFVV